MGVYVALDNVSDETLLLCGYVKIDENEDHLIYRHFGEDIVVFKDDPFLIVEDINDAAILGSEIIPLPPKDC